MYSDKRRYVRIEVNAPGKIITLKGLHLARSFRCTVVNVSEGGALIHTDIPVVEEEFYLELYDGLSDLRLCSVIRRLHNSNYLGVRFVTSASVYK